VVPLRDDNPTQITPIINYGIIAANVVVFIHEISLSRPQLEQFLYTWALVPKTLTLNFSGEWIKLFTSQFLHAGFLHVGFNMLFLWIFGNNVEEQLGHIKYLIFYLTCGALAALTQWFFSSHSSIPSLGASGAIAGVLGAYILKFPQARVLTLVPLGIFITVLRIPAFFFLGWWFLEQAISGYASLNVHTNIGMASGGVAYWAHIGGFLSGVILGPLLGLFSSNSGRGT